MHSISHSSSTTTPSLRCLIKQIHSAFVTSYTIDNIYYDSRIINDIIYNEKSHIVAKFKDYLIIDDVSEFLKRYYTSIESSVRLPRFFEYYETYSRIFPNYTALPESKFIYKNIHKKQKMIDKQQHMELSMERNKQNKKNKHSKDEDVINNVFSTEVCCSIAEDSSLINEVFGMDKVKKKKTKRKTDANVNSDKDNHNDNNDKSSNTNNDNTTNQSVIDILKLINKIEIKEDTRNVVNKQNNAIMGNTGEQKEKHFTKQIKLRINDNIAEPTRAQTKISSKHYSRHHYWPSTSNISRTKDSINNSSNNVSTLPKHRSTISSLLPKSKVNNYFFKNLTMNIFNEIHLNSSPMANNTINHSSLFQNHHTKSSKNIKNKCIFPITHRNNYNSNSHTTEAKTIKNIEAELIKNKIKKHSSTKSHHQRNRNSVIVNSKAHGSQNSVVVNGNTLHNNTTHIRNSLSFANGNNNNHTLSPSSQTRTVQQRSPYQRIVNCNSTRGTSNSKTILTSQRCFIDKFTQNLKSHRHMRHISNGNNIHYYNSNNNRIQTDRVNTNVELSLLRKLISKSNSNKKIRDGCSNNNNRRANGIVVTTTTSPSVNNYKSSSRANRNNVYEQQPITTGNCNKKGRNWRKVSNYAFRTNNVGYCNSNSNSNNNNRQNLLFGSKDNCLGNKMGVNKGKGCNMNGVVKGIKIDGFGKVVENGKGANEIGELRRYFYKGNNNVNVNINGNKAYTDRNRKK